MKLCKTLNQSSINICSATSKYTIYKLYTNKWENKVYFRGHNTGHNTFQGYPHMDHCIGCHTCAFTVAYAVLWLEVLLHYCAVKVFHIRRVTGGEANPTLFGKSKKCPGFGKNRPDFVHPEIKFIIQNIVL